MDKEECSIFVSKICEQVLNGRQKISCRPPQSAEVCFSQKASLSQIMIESMILCKLLKSFKSREQTPIQKKRVYQTCIMQYWLCSRKTQILFFYFGKYSVFWCFEIWVDIFFRVFFNPEKTVVHNFCTMCCIQPAAFLKANSF